MRGVFAAVFGANVARSVRGAGGVCTCMSCHFAAVPVVPVLAHIAGLPVEETVASFAPVVAVAGGCCVATLRARLRRMRGGRSVGVPPSEAE